VVLACALAALLPAVCPPARAEVKTRVGADGTIEIYNDAPSTVAAAPRALRLKPVPRTDWSEWIREHADLHGVDPRLVQAIVQVESGYNARARSRAGAVGLMQLMPGTARTLQVGNRYDAEQNIRGGVAYLRQMIDRFSGRLELAIAAYNAGPGAVERYGGIPPYAETRDYVDRVLTLYRGGSSFMMAIGSGGAPVQLNGLAQDATPSPLRQALANGALRANARPAAAPAPATIELAAAAPTVPVPMPAAPIAAPAAAPAAAVVPAAAVIPARARPASPGVVVPASLPVEAQSASLQPATGG
jgi:hypothetical protein